MSLSTAIHKKC